MLLEFYENQLGNFTKAWVLKNKKYNLQVLKFHNQPFEAVNTFVTLGLSHYSLNQESGVKIHQEFVFSVNQKFNENDIASFILTFAESVLMSSRAVKRGEVIGPGKALIEGVESNSHFITSPVFFGEEFEMYNNGIYDIYMCWLLPIREKEVVFIKENGWSKFELKLETISNIDMFWNLNRDGFSFT